MPMECEKKLQSKLNRLREWASTQSQMVIRKDDKWLRGFLRCCNYRTKQTKKKIKNHYVVRYLTTECFANRCPFREEVVTLLKRGSILPLPNSLGVSGPRILYIHMNTIDNLMDSLKVLFMVQDILMMEDDQFSLYGVIYWIDMGGISLDIVKQLTPVYIKKYVTVCQEACPVQIVKWYVTNDTFGIRPIFKAMKTLVKKNLRAETQYFPAESSNSELLKYIPKEYFPRDYGGNNGSLNDLAIYWEEKVKDYKSWFDEDDRYGIIPKKKSKDLSA